MTESFETLTKIGLYAGLLLALGGSAASWLFPSPRAQRDWRVVSAALLVVLVSLVLRLLAHSVATFGDDGLSAESLDTVALRSRWGGGWRLQGYAATIAAALSFLAWSRPRLFATLATVAVCLLAATFPRLGHSAALPATSVIAAVHLLAAGGWVGTLAVLLMRGAPSVDWPRFSLVAASGVATLVITGLLLATSFVPTVSDLVSAAYGRLLLVKLLLFGAIGLCGALNWRRLHAREPGAQPPLGRVEVALAALLIVVTAFLTETAHP